MAWFGDDDAFQGFIDKHGLTFRQVSDDAGDLYARFEVPAQPAWVIIGPDGAVHRTLGTLDDDELDDLLAEVSG